MKKKVLVALLFLFAACEMASANTINTAASTSRFVDRFDEGIPSWQSYPLAQDIGYDPSVYTEPGRPAALVRDVVNFGEKEDEVGLIRSLHLKASGQLRISMVYSTQLTGEVVDGRLMITSKDGHKYEVRLPVANEGKRSFTVSGDELKLPHADVDIDAVVVMYRTRKAVPGSHSFLKVYTFQISSAGGSELHLLSPKTIASSTLGIPVTEGVATPGRPTNFILDAAPQTARVFDAEGKEVDGETAITGKTVVWTPSENDKAGLWTVKIASVKGESSFRVLLLHAGSVDEGEGLLTPARLQQLKTDKQFKELRNNIHLEAKRLAENLAYNTQAGDSIALLPDKSVLAGLESYLHLMSNYGDAIEWNALDYRLNGDRTALEVARKALLTVSAWKTWTPPWFTAHGMHTYYVTGVFTERLALGYSLVSEALPAQDRATIASAVQEKSIQPTVVDYYLAQRMPTGASNHMAHSVGGSIAAWAALDAADPQWRAQHATELSELIVAYEDLLGGLFPGDGSEVEPAGYDDFAMEGMTYGIAPLENLGITPKGLPGMMNSFWWLKYAKAGSNLVLDTGDTRSDMGNLYGFAWMAEHEDSAELRQLYSSSVPAANSDSSVPNLLNLICCTRPPGHVDALPTSRIFPLRGSAVLRSGWGDSDTVLSIRAGPWFNHEHHDEGSFQISAGGALLVSEGGYADYYRDPSYKDYFAEAPAHNTILIDHDAFSQRPYQGRYWKALAHYPGIEHSLLGESFDYLDANLQPAYGSTLMSFRRKVIFVKPGLIVIDDALRSGEPHVFTWQLHVNGAVSSLENTSSLTLHDASGRVSATLLDEKPGVVWQRTRTPNAVQTFTDLDRRPVGRHSTISVDSPKSEDASFVEAISINDGDGHPSIDRIKTVAGEGFVQNSTEVESIVLVRRGRGRLVAQDCSTDGDALAVTRHAAEELHVLATNANIVTIDSKLKFSGSHSGDFNFDQIKGQASITAQFNEDTDVEIQGAPDRNMLSVDAGGMEGYANGEKLHLTAGKHVIRFAMNQ